MSGNFRYGDHTSLFSRLQRGSYQGMRGETVPGRARPRLPSRGNGDCLAEAAQGALFGDRPTQEATGEGGQGQVSPSVLACPTSVLILESTMDVPEWGRELCKRRTVKCRSPDEPPRGDACTSTLACLLFAAFLEVFGLALMNSTAEIPRMMQREGHSHTKKAFENDGVAFPFQSRQEFS